MSTTSVGIVEIVGRADAVVDSQESKNKRMISDK